MGRPGRKRRLDVESEYWQLVLSGVGTVEACKRLGIGRKTGYRWRAENGGLPPAVRGEGLRSQRYLSLLERHRIATLRRDGLGVRQIAEELGRSPATISRELRRNTAAHDRSYDGDMAHGRARERLRRPRCGRLLVDDDLRRHVEAKLELEWSPEQIAGWLRVTFPNRPGWHLCHETIYQALYLANRGGLPRRLTRRLRTGRPLRKAAPARHRTHAAVRRTGPAHRPTTRRRRASGTRRGLGGRPDCRP